MQKMEEEGGGLADEFLNDFYMDDGNAQENDLETLEKYIPSEATNFSYDEFETFMTEIRKYRDMQRDMSMISEKDKDPEYMLLVNVPKMLLAVTNQISALHTHIKEIYSKQFPELPILVPDSVEYAMAVKQIKLESDITKVDLSQILTPAVIIGVVTAAANRKNTFLNEKEYEIAFKECDELIHLQQCYQEVIDYLESRMNFLAPNMTSIVGPEITAKLISAAGGLGVMISLPSNIVQLLGQKQIALNGFSSTHHVPHAGYLYYSDLVQDVDVDLRKKANRFLAGKVTLAARADFEGGSGDGSVGRFLKTAYDKRVAELVKPPPLKGKKVIVPPDVKRRKNKRGGKRVKRIREMYSMTEIRKDMNRMEFGKPELTVAGRGFGDLAKTKLKVEERKILKNKKLEVKGNATVFGGVTTFGRVGGATTSVAQSATGGIVISDPLRNK
ncbi:U4/U6 small nuclear ribonucleoprotein Prp31, putative [Entamoeba invadens IP1]|uniref:U4/U6 small nuclear ribonucleoprotein Prp31, putative n=1 Tax=Entamoeba invadens IP1 TaxID=370355 RepID=A0A0A1UCH9_ENTIV|nr:U4/U6 small nuclear ribonucleoprotein Prp31, putative [Entamoeba invadens IP1]ELP91368.1 U4/U6 small nuclear ribonucleoprotein Prp31, putative [Entamoeba invadens IP1]|eukprot:XP_004258139.1 U4/U6 small nuclear ribonucleoprotein Prp31, putative [Entamoeba invadens IP1]